MAQPASVFGVDMTSIYNPSTTDEQENDERFRPKREVYSCEIATIPG